MTCQYYVLYSDKITNKHMQQKVVYIQGERLKYKIVEFTRVRGIEYNVYELRPAPEPWWMRYLCIKTKPSSPI